MHLNYRIGILILLNFLCYTFMYAQTKIPTEEFIAMRDSAVSQLKSFPNPDTARVNALLKVLYAPTYLAEREQVMPYLREATALSKRLNYPRGIVSCHMSTGAYYKSASRYPEALMQYDSALMAIPQGDTSLNRLKAVSYERKGAIYLEQGNLYAALDHFFESLQYQESHSFNRTVRLNLFITDIYLELGNFEKAEEFSKQNIKILESNYSVPLANSIYFNVIDIAIAKRDIPTALKYLDKVAPFIPSPNQVQESFGYYLKRGDVSTLQEKYVEAQKFYELAYKYAKQGGHRKSINAILQRLSSTALKLDDVESAKKFTLENLELSEGINTKQDRINALTSLGEYYNYTGQHNKAAELFKEAIALKDSVAIESNIKQMNILGAIYETDKQNKEISRLQKEKDAEAANAKYKSVLNRFLIGATIFLLIVGYLGYTNFRKGRQLDAQQQTIQKQKIRDLEKDKQLLTIDAMLKGQEDERNRIAKDLHDGLGSLLSGTKLSLINVKENLLLSPVHAQMFDKSLSMLDHTIGDLRKVAHNLMPEGLVKFGLTETLHDFCESIQSSSGVKIRYQHLGEERRLDSTAEVFIYRIIQELVNNAIKHAEATEIIVQIVFNDDKIGITVEDNGKGFDETKLELTKGAGMSNIRYRMQYFHGTMDLVTAPGKGTSINIELTV